MLRQYPIELSQEQLLVWFRVGISGEDEFAALGGRELHIQQRQSAELVQRLAGCETWCFEPEPVLQGDLNAIGKESDKDVSFDAMFKLVIDRPHRQIAFQLFKGGFDFGQLQVQRDCKLNCVNAHLKTVNRSEPEK